MVKEGARNPANIDVVRRDDNTLQWALNGKPLYYFAADSQRGDVKGDGQGGVWHVIRAEGKRTEVKARPTRSVDGNWSYGGTY